MGEQVGTQVERGGLDRHDLGSAGAAAVEEAEGRKRTGCLRHAVHGHPGLVIDLGDQGSGLGDRIARPLERKIHEPGAWVGVDLAALALEYEHVVAEEGPSPAHELRGKAALPAARTRDDGERAVGLVHGARVQRLVAMGQRGQPQAVSNSSRSQRGSSESAGAQRMRSAGALTWNSAWSA